MLINSIRVENYKRIADKKVKFGNGLNVIIGNNEAGKSTVSSALLDALFLSPTTKTKDVKAIKAWKQERLGLLELELSLEKEHFSLFKDYENGVLKLIDKNRKVLIEDQKKFNQLLKEKTGIGSTGMYINTAHIAQDDVALIKNDADLLDAVQSIAAESNENISLKKIIKNLEGKIKEIEKGRGKLTINKGRLAQLEFDLEKIETEIENKQKAGDDMASKRGELVKLEQRLNKLEPDTKSLSELVKINEDIMKAKEDNVKLNEELDNLERKIDRLKNLPVDGGLEIDINKANKDLLMMLDVKKSSVVFANIKWLLLIGGLVLSLLGLFKSELNLLLLIGIPFIALGVILFIKQKARTDKANKVLGKWGCATLVELEQLILRSGNLQQNLSERNGILMGETEDDLEKKRKELYKKINMLEIKYLTPQMLKLELSSREYYDKLKEIDNNQSEIEKLKSKRIELRTILSNKLDDGANIEDLIEQKSKIESEISYWEGKCDVLKLVLEAMQFSLTRTAENFKNKSSQFVAKNLARLTSGRYSKVKIGKDLSVQVYSDDKQDWVEDIKELSKGTVDQIFFVIRLAFFVMLHKSEYMPLILDDPFTGYDELRLKAVKELLQDLSKDIQILLFTHNPVYRDWGNTIELA